MFVKVNENSYVNLEQVKEIFLRTPSHFPYGGSYVWKFIYSNSPWDSEDAPGYLAASSKPFETKEEAVKWFEEEIEPVLKDINNIKYSLTNLYDLDDIKKHLEEIIGVLENR